jgi:hypothetical protein
MALSSSIAESVWSVPKRYANGRTSIWHELCGGIASAIAYNKEGRQLGADESLDHHPRQIWQDGSDIARGFPEQVQDQLSDIQAA